MNVRKLVKMANEIGQFFEADPDTDAAIEGITSHLARFWEPRMRRELLAHVDAGAQGGETALRPLVLRAVTQNRARLAPK